MSIVSGTVGAILSSKAQNRATQAQAQQAREYNQLLADQFAQSRGSTGHAILPEYLGGTEKEFATDSADVSRALKDYYGNPADVVARGAAVAGRYKPLLDEGTKAAYGIFSGDLERRRLANAEPTFQARTALADTTATGIYKGIRDRLNAISASNAGKGFVGSGSAAENLAFRTSIEGNQAAGAARATAELQNAQERQSIRDEILKLELQSPELAGALAAQAIRFETLPADVAGAISRGELSPLDYFRIGVGQPGRPEMAPWIQPNASIGQILANAGAEAGNTAGRYFLNRNLANQYGNNGGWRSGYPAAQQYGYGGGSAAGYPGYTPYNGYADTIDYGAGLGTAAGDAAFVGADLGY
jgi:hypothetical protein